MKRLLTKALRFHRQYGTRKLVRESLARLEARPAPAPILPPPSHPPAAEPEWIKVRELVHDRQSALAPLRLYTVPDGDAPRVSIVTDSINRGSLYGGVGTAIILAAIIAEARGARLRIITRNERADPNGLAGLLDVYGIDLATELELAHAPCTRHGYDLDAYGGELFLTTSWWTTASTLARVAPESILYLLQEDERMFYPHGDERLHCTRVLEHRELRFVVNTKLLFDHLVQSGLPHLATNAVWFEPSFPPHVFYPRPRPSTGKRTLLIYARPNNLRNLFLFAVDVVETAITRGLLRLDSWDIVLVGKDIPRVAFDDGRYRPARRENLAWTEYSELVGTVDLGLCLMYTPHPSYPPFDLAASGAVVVTNRCGVKQSLERYSRNIVCGDLDMASMLDALGRALRLVDAPQEREANYRLNSLTTNWRQSFAEVVRRFSSAH